MLIRRTLDALRLPDLPPPIQFTDRANGTIWTLIHDQSSERIGITDVPPHHIIRGHARRFDAYGEPLLSYNPRIRIFVRNGRLGYEMFSLPHMERTRSTPRLLSRKAFQRYALELYLGTWEQAGDPLGWRTVEEFA